MTMYSKVWINKDGKQIPYDEMTNSDLKKLSNYVCDLLTELYFEGKVNGISTIIPEWLGDAMTALDNEYEKRLKEQKEINNVIHNDNIYGCDYL